MGFIVKAENSVVRSHATCGVCLIEGNVVIKLFEA